jgi:DNA-binding transcriptional LysR family regulator
MAQHGGPELSSLRLLLAVRSHGSVGRAARAEGISQPAASKRISGLERELGVRLLTRGATGSDLTPQGRVVSDWAGRVLDTLDQMLEAVSTLRPGAGEELRVAASMTIAEHLVPAWLLAMRSGHPDLHVALQVANSERVQALVLEGEGELGFVEGPSVDDRLASRQVTEDRLAVVVAPGHPWSRRGRHVRADELLATPLVVREPGSGTRATVDRVLRGGARPLLELGSNEAVKGAVIAGAGPAILSVLAVQADLDVGRLVEVRVEGVDLSRRLSAVWARGRRLTDPARRLLRVTTGTVGSRGTG